MDIMFAVILMIFGWVTLIISWDMWEYLLFCVFLALSSMVFFISAGVCFLWVTQPYQVIVYSGLNGSTFNSTIVTGEQMLSSYTPFGYVMWIFALLSIIWIVVRCFDEVQIWAKKFFG
jgi:hypothetical protein